MRNIGKTCFCISLFVYMNILVACEESQRVCIEFRKLGHIAYSCDLQDCSGGHPEWHIKDDVSKYLNGASDDFLCSDLIFYTQDGSAHLLPWKWDMIIAHPPCTYFSNATMVNLGRKDYPEIFNEEWKQTFFKNRNNAFDFVKKIYNSNCNMIAIENVVGYLNTHFMKPDQIIQPFYFGDPYRKATCLWLKGLPKLYPTQIVQPICKWVKHNLKKKNDLTGYQCRGVYGSKERSKTFKGVAIAMASQWGAL